MRNIINTILAAAALLATNANAQFTYKYVKSDFDGTYRIAYCPDATGTSLLKMESSPNRIESANQMALGLEEFKHSVILTIGAKEWAALKNAADHATGDYTEIYDKDLNNIETVEKAKSTIEDNLGRTVSLYITGRYIYLCDDDDFRVDALFSGNAKTNRTITGSPSRDRSTLWLSEDLAAEDYFQELTDSKTTKMRVNESHCEDKIFSFNTSNIKAAFAFMSQTGSKTKLERDITQQQKESIAANGIRELKLLQDRIQREADSAIQAENQRAAAEKAAKIRAQREADSTAARQKAIKDSTELKNALDLFYKNKNKIDQLIDQQIETAQLLKKVTKDPHKTEFLSVTFGRQAHQDLRKSEDNTRKLMNAKLIIDTNNITHLRITTESMQKIIENKEETHFSTDDVSIRKLIYAGEYNHRTTRPIEDVQQYAMIDQDFLEKPLKKTELYKKHRDEYKQKKIDLIEPTTKHISIMYVYGGGKSPLGANLAIYPTQNIGLWAEYLTHTQIEGLTNDNPQDYSNPQEAEKLFQQLKDENLFKLEDAWDKSYQTINLGVNIPFNYKKNLVLGIGAGKSITTEHRRYQLREDFQTLSIYKAPTTATNGQFYLDSDRRTTSNLNFSANLTLILKPLTIKIGANINDRDRRDTRINIGIGLTF